MFSMACTASFPKYNCIPLVSPSRKEEREALEFLCSPENELLQIVRNVISCVFVLERYYTRRLKMVSDQK